MATGPRTLIFLGVVFIAIGLTWNFWPKNFFLGKLPGDILIKKGKSSFYFPITSCIIISILLSIILSIFNKK